jgi:hypothetical protein
MPVSESMPVPTDVKIAADAVVLMLT